MQASEQAADDTEDQQPPAAAKGKAKAKPKAKPKPKSRPAPHPLGQRPPTPEEPVGTTWYGPGRINRNGGHWRVFVVNTDRCDRKIRIGEDPDASFAKALSLALGHWCSIDFV